MRRLLFLLWIVCLSAVGCGDNVDIGLVAERMQALTAESAIQRTLPAEVLAAMNIRAEEMDKTLKVMLDNTTTDEFHLNRKKKLIEKGIHEMDFHAMQKAFYTRYIDAGGVAIVANEEVEDVYLYAARDAILVMTSRYPYLRERLLSKHGRFYMILVLEKDDFYDIPELQLNNSVLHDDNDDYYIWWAGACNTNSGATHVPGAFDTITGNCFASTQYGGPCPPVSTFIHEFAHVLEWEIEHHHPGFRDRLQEAYAQSVAKFGEEVVSGSYILHDSGEYWADGTQHWMMGKGHKEFIVREMPELAELLAEWYPHVECIQEIEFGKNRFGNPHGIIYTSVSWEIVDDE